MRHDFSLAGFSLRLRPVCGGDAEFIVNLRAARGEYLHPGAQTAAEQLQWLEEYYARPDDYFFTAERLKDGRREGIIGIYGMDKKTRRAEWGRWVVRKDSAAAVECLWLMYTFAFSQLNLASVFAATIPENKKLVSFHDFYGAETVELRKNTVPINGKMYDTVIQQVTREAWENIEPRLRHLAKRGVRTYNV